MSLTVSRSGWCWLSHPSHHSWPGTRLLCQPACPQSSPCCSATCRACWPTPTRQQWLTCARRGRTMLEDLTRLQSAFTHARTQARTHARTHARTYAYPTDYISGAHALNVCACVFYVVATPLLTHAHLLPAHPNCRLRRYGKVTPRGARYMDMATYFSTFRGVPHSAAGMVAPFARLLPELRMAAPAVGLTEMPGHVNASCGGWPQCANVSNPACGCLDYGWNQSAFATFVRAVEAAGVTEIDVSLLYA
jgi:hypothetical protein